MVRNHGQPFRFQFRFTYRIKVISFIEQRRSLSRDAASTAEIACTVREVPAERRWLAVEISEASSIVFEKVASAEIHFASSLRNTFNFLI